MKNAKRLIALLLGVLLIFTMVGCQSNETQEPVVANPDEGTETGGEVQDPGEGYNPYPDPSNPVKFSLFADCTWLSYDNLDGFTGQAIEKETGITFDFTKATDGEQLILMMSSGGEMPDLVMTGSGSKQNKLSTPDLCYPLNDLITQYAPDWEIPEIVKNINAYYGEDGNFYMLKNEFNTIDQIKACKTVGPNFGQMHMRKDIYEALGSPAMNNKEAIYKVFDQVKEKYPEMTPIVVNMRNIGSIAAQLVGMDVGMPKDANGNYCHILSDTKFRDLMLTFNELYTKGYMSKENFTYSSDEQIFDFASKGNAFIVTHYAGNDEQMFTGRVQATNPDASFVQVPLTDDWAYTLGVSGWAGLFITKNCHDQETAIKFLRWSKEPENQITTMIGERGVDWQLSDDGVLETLDRFNNSMEAGTKDQEYTPVSFLISATDYIRESMNFYASATPETRLIFDDATQRANWSNVVDLVYPKSGMDEEVWESDLWDLYKEYRTKLGTAETQEEFDALYDELMQIAADSHLEEVNAFYANTYSTLCDELNAK